MAQQWLIVVMKMQTTVIAVMFVVLATQLTSITGNVSAGLVTLITIGSTLTTIIVAYPGVEISLGAISRLKSFSEETEQEDWKGEDVVPDKKWPKCGQVVIQDVDVSYDGTDKALQDLNLVIEAGGKGCYMCTDWKVSLPFTNAYNVDSSLNVIPGGKFTILALLLRLVDPDPANLLGATSSAILIDNLPLNMINRTTLRERLIFASQYPVFLPDSTSFRTDLDPWGQALDEECIVVLHELGLGPVGERKGGLDAVVNGAELSAGTSSFSV